LGKSILSFQPLNESQSEHYVADHYPKGRLWSNRHVKDTIIYNYILVLSSVFKLFFGDLFNLVKNRDINQADDLLKEWETSVRIPENIPRRDTIEGRREAVKCKKSKIPVCNIDNGIVSIESTFEEYVRCLTGIEIEIRTAQVEGTGSVFPMEFPIEFGIGAATGSFVFIIGVPLIGEYTNNFFPMSFAINFFDPEVPDATIELLDLILDDVIPSFCYWVYEVIKV
jgi:hypothetical protein